MRRFLSIVGGLAVAAVALASSNSKLVEYARTLENAKSVRATYTVQTLGKSSETYVVTLAKPNLARVETPREIVVADGKQVTRFDKAQRIYVRTGQTERDLRGLLQPDELRLFAGFFDPKAYQAPLVRDMGVRSINGTAYETVVAVPESPVRKQFTFFINPEDRLPRKKQIEREEATGKSTTLLDVREVKLDEPTAADAFRFEPPAGSEMVSPEEYHWKWYTSYDEALAVARASKRKLLVLFVDAKSDEVRRLAREVHTQPAFRALSRRYVFVRIDAIQQPVTSGRYEIRVENVPVHVVVDAQKDEEVERQEGYTTRAAFFDWIQKVK